MNANDTFMLLRAFCDELVRCGMRHACTSPGSRSAPLVLSLVREPGLRCWSHVDERCAGFFALGMAKAGGRPAAVACTSGTAAAHLAPAVHEAHEARVPLLVLTADRPPELREVGAGQTIDQVKLFGAAAKWYFDVGIHRATVDRQRWMRALACRAYWTALADRPGVVHLNFPLREPLVPEGELLEVHPGRDGGAPWVRRAPRPAGPGAPGHELLRMVSEARRGVVVAGRMEGDPDAGEAVAQFAAAAGFPLLADPLSGARRGPAAIAHYDATLRDSRAAVARPDLVIRVGDLPTSKPLRAWLARLHEAPQAPAGRGEDFAVARARQVVLDPHGAWPDPAGVLEASLPLEPGPALRALLPELSSGDPAWLDLWRAADARTAGAIEKALGRELSEPRVAALLGEALPAQATLVVASSMPVRDVETFFPTRDDAPRVLSNRGANGIDGTVSTAFGAAAAGEGPVVVLLGDVALAHDVGGLLAAGRLGLHLTIVLLNNDGGGIFHFLPIAGEEDAFEEHVATPHGLDFAHAAALYGCEHRLVEDTAGLEEALRATLGAPGTTILEVRTERPANEALHRRVWAAIAAA